MNMWVLLASAVAALSFMLFNVLYVLYAERKIMGHMQVRLGPMRHGWHGLLQTPADVLKMLTKEDVIPEKADKWLFAMGPVMIVAAAFTLFVTIPWQPGFVPRELNLGVFFVLAVASLTPIGIVIGGWASNNKYSLLGGLRAAGQQISYEVPMLLSVLGVVMLSGSLKLSEIVEAQAQVWFIVPQILGFLIFLITAVAEMNRVPFDMPEAESELVAGFGTEYSGMRWGMWFVAEYSVMLILSALAALLFLGGWNLWGLEAPNGPIPGWIIMGVKTYSITFIMIWLRATLPRTRVDQLMEFGWKVLLPLALVNILVTGLWIYLTGGGG